MTTLTKVADVGNDVLLVTGLDAEGHEITATGWVTAMSNHFPASAYDETGQLLPDSEAREMTDEERHAYWTSLLVEVAPIQAVETTETVLFEVEAPVALDSTD